MIYFLILSYFSKVFTREETCFESVFAHRKEDSLLPSFEPFCVLKDNHVEKYEEMVPITSEEQLDEFLKETGRDTEGMERETPKLVSYSDGAPFTLPTSTFSEKCVGEMMIAIGVNISSSCLINWLVFNETECSTNAHSSAARLFSQPFTTSNKTSPEVKVEFSEEPKSSEWIAGQCKNVIKQMKVRFTLNGTAIVKVSVRNVEYSTLTSENFTNLRQEFVVDFIDVRDIVDDKNAGYKQGDIIIQEKVGGRSHLQIVTGEDCSSLYSIDVHFKHRLQSSCIIRASSCEDALSQIRRVFDRFHLKRIFSTPNGNETFPIIYRNNTEQQSGLTNNHCRLVSSVHIDVSYARQGDKDDYILKIFSAVYSYAVEEVEFVENIPTKIALTYTVEFSDRTAGATARFASLPRIDLRLPNDFFYPFIASKSTSTLFYANGIILIFIRLL